MRDVLFIRTAFFEFYSAVDFRPAFHDLISNLVLGFIHSCTYQTMPFQPLYTTSNPFCMHSTRIVDSECSTTRLK